MFLSKDDFSLAVNLVPLISVDFCLLDSSNKLLFVKRNCSPAKDFFFTPGGRIRKNEKFDDAIKKCKMLHDHFDHKMEGYYNMWIERCEYMKTQDLPKDWNGVFIATTK